MDAPSRPADPVRAVSCRSCAGRRGVGAATARCTLAQTPRRRSWARGGGAVSPASRPRSASRRWLLCTLMAAGISHHSAWSGALAWAGRKQAREGHQHRTVTPIRPEGRPPRSGADSGRCSRSTDAPSSASTAPARRPRAHSSPRRIRRRWRTRWPGGSAPPRTLRCEQLLKLRVVLYHLAGQEHLLRR